MISAPLLWQVRLSNAAAADFGGILRWTKAHCGEGQALVYEDALIAALTLLSEGPSPPGAKARSDIGRGIHTLHVSRIRRRGRHVVPFRVTGHRQLEIIRILHDSMDLARHLSDE